MQMVAATPKQRRLRFELSKPQTRAFRRIEGPNSKRNKVCLSWGRGVGKSWFIRFIAWVLVATWDRKLRPGASLPGVRIVLFMPTLAQFKRVHGELLEAENNGQWKHLGGEFNHTESVIRFPGGSWIRIVSAEQRNNVAGIRCDVVLADESDDIDIPVFDALVSPWLSEPHSLQLTVFGGTPRRGRYGLLYRQHRRGLDRQPHCFTSHATYKDVPEFVDPAYVALEKANVTPELFSREWECDFDSAEGLVYGMFDERFHVRKPDPRTVWTEFLVGVDHGWEDPGVFLLIGVAGSGNDATAHIIHEIYRTRQDEDFWRAQVPVINAMARLKSPSVRVRWWADPSRPDRIATLKKAGALILDTDNAIEDGCSTVATMLAIRETNDDTKYSRLYVDPSCVNTIREFGLYKRKRDPRNGDRILDDIVDRDNHCFRAGTLVATTLGARPIEQVSIGDLVHTRLGPRSVTKLWNHRVAPLWRLTLSTGATIDATPDHKFWTPDYGWLRLNELRYGIRLLGCPSASSGSPGTEMEPASSAAASSDTTGSSRDHIAPSDVVVLAVEPLNESAPVFCLSVDEAHEFFANGVLVSNCMDALRYPLFNRFGKPTPAPPSMGQKRVGFG